MSRLNVDAEDFYYPGDGSDIDRLREKIEQLPENQLVNLIPEMKAVKLKSIDNVTAGFNRRHISAETSWELVATYFGTTDTKTAPFAMMSPENSKWFIGFLKTKYAPEKLLTYCLDDPYRDYLYYFGLGHPRAPIDLVIKAINKYRVNLRHAACNPNLPTWYIKECVTSNDNRTRENVACNPSANAEHLYQLSQDEDFMVRLLVTENSSTPGWVLFKCLQDTDDIIRDNANRSIMRTEKDAFMSWFTDEQQEIIKDLPRDWVVKMVVNGLVEIKESASVQ